MNQELSNKGPYRIPIYHHPMPDVVKAVNLSWVVFTGAADDERIGEPGLYHWFEHVPFRGTVNYPNGYADTKGRFVRHSGHIGAWTNQQLTTYNAFIPQKVWREALPVITDLFAQPLLHDEGICAEREIIAQEIQETRSNNKRNPYYELPEILWPGHPLGHPTLGNEAALRKMNPELLLKAHREGYDSKRCIFVAVGDIWNNELVDELYKLQDTLPNRNLSERRAPHYYGPLPAWRNGEVTVKETGMPGSVVMMLFPVEPGLNRDLTYFRWRTVADLIGFGTGASPLYRIVREERNLVYSTYVTEFYTACGGYIGLVAEAKQENMNKIVQAFKDVLALPTIRSVERLHEVRAGRLSRFEMSPIDPSHIRDTLIHRFISSGTWVTDEKYEEEILSIGMDDLIPYLDKLKPENAHTIIFEGKGK